MLRIRLFCRDFERMAFKRSAVRSRLSPPGRLAQLVAHPLDVREVTSSSLVSSTKENHGKSRGFLVFRYYFMRLPQGEDPPESASRGLSALESRKVLSCTLSNNFVLLQALLQAKRGPAGDHPRRVDFISCIPGESLLRMESHRCSIRTHSRRCLAFPDPCQWHRSRCRSAA